LPTHHCGLWLQPEPCCLIPEALLDHVLWIGGPPGCGKTTIGRWLAHLYDLQAYNADAHTWEHHDRSLADGDPGASRWESRTPDERWLRMPPAEMAEFSLEMNAERFRQMVDDVRALSAEPGVVMEGTPLLPWLVEEHLGRPEAAVWLLPTPGFQEARLRERAVTTWRATSDPELALANRIERERLVGEAIERAALDRGYAVIRVDESRDLETMKILVEDVLRGAIASARSASTPERRSEVQRAENAVVLRQVMTYL